MRCRALFLAFAVLVPLLCVAQSPKYRDYIDKYSDLAISQMRRHNIPASITMAQALLESGAGTSMLAVKGRNHFGIKAHNDWVGPVMLKDDDAPNEKFRVYAFDEESYEDHSLFLLRGKRYASLFTLSVTDYKGWAYGLKAAGYATNPNYALSLIKIIEDYNLTSLDQDALSKRHPTPSKTPIGATIPNYSTNKNKALAHGHHAIGFNNSNYYVIARAGDTYKSLSKEYDISERKLRRNNEVDKKYVLKEGDIVYFEKKQTKAHKNYKRKSYIIQQGESLYDVAQKFGMRLKTLYKVNNFLPDHTIVVGERVRLR